jgi:hypothetical protein
MRSDHYLKLHFKSGQGFRVGANAQGRVVDREEEVSRLPTPAVDYKLIAARAAGLINLRAGYADAADCVWALRYCPSVTSI